MSTTPPAQTVAAREIEGERERKKNKKTVAGSLSNVSCGETKPEEEGEEG